MNAKANNLPVLIVDDEDSILEVLEGRLESGGYRCLKASSGEEALAVLEREKVGLIISDVRMPGLSGKELLVRIKEKRISVPVILLTAYATIADAVETVKAGAVDYLAKPFDGKELLNKVREVLSQAEKERLESHDAHLAGEEQKRTKPQAQKAVNISDILWGGKSPAMKELYNIIERVAPTDVNVLIIGESGTGKELIARLIHERSKRAGRPIIIVDCGSTPPGLLESELFGHVKGSFTHAIRDKKGLIEEADNGTLFLDEIGNVSQDMQIRLLRFLESRKIRRIGDTREIPVDCRVIAATNSDLLKDVSRGEFREDLYYRLRVVQIDAPPLRNRKDDIILLAEKFVEVSSRKQGIQPVSIHPETLARMKEYSWPGNVRQLKNSIEAGVVLCRDGLLKWEDLQILEAFQSSRTAFTKGGGDSGPDQAPLSLDESERMAIIRALEKSGWVQKEAADLLGISRRAIHYKINKYDIQIPGRKLKKKFSPDEYQD